MAKIMMIHHSGLIGGAGVSLINVMKLLSENNEIQVFIPSEPDDMEKILEPYQSKKLIINKYGRRIGAITYYSGGDKIYSMRFWYRICLILRQWKMWNNSIKKCNPDIIIVNSKILCWMSLLPQVKCRKSICFVRETMHGSPSVWLNSIISKLLDRYSKVIFLSAYDEKKESLSKAETYVIHNYIEDNQFDLSISRKSASNKLGISDDTFHVLYVGGVSKMKGFDLAVQAVLQSGRDVELIVAGNDFEGAKKSKDKSVVAYAEQLEHFIKENDKYGQIHIVGKQKNMSNCYAASDVLVFPMRAPHQARPAFEAGSYGKPVIITDFENIKEFVINNENGFTVKKENAENIAEKILFLRDNKEVRDTMGLKNYEKTVKFHSKVLNCQKILELIKE